MTTSGAIDALDPSGDHSRTAIGPVRRFLDLWRGMRDRRGMPIYALGVAPGMPVHELTADHLDELTAAAEALRLILWCHREQVEIGGGRPRCTGRCDECGLVFPCGTYTLAQEKLGDRILLYVPTEHVPLIDVAARDARIAAKAEQ